MSGIGSAQEGMYIAARRFAEFSSVQTFRRLENGEWMLDIARSQPSLAKQVNDFLEKNSVVPVFVSAPAYRMYSSPAGAEEIIVHTAVSVLYEPKELVVYEQSADSQEQSVGFPIAVFTGKGGVQSVQPVPVSRESGRRIVIGKKGRR
jgi:hypothetical protein